MKLSRTVSVSRIASHLVSHSALRGVPRVDPRRAAVVAALVSVAAAGLASAPAVHAQVIVLAPPAARYEAVPTYHRHGYVWRGGYWGWSYGRYVWVPGYWTAAPGYYVVPPPQPMQPPQPSPPPRVAQVIRLPADALFAFDRGGVDDLLPGGRAAIADAAARLRSQPYGRIEVRGYTDRLGSAGYNAALSQRRADSVRTLLIGDGVPANRITAVGLGARDPVSQCGDNQPRDALVHCLQPDRRVELVEYARN